MAPHTTLVLLFSTLCIVQQDHNVLSQFAATSNLPPKFVDFSSAFFVKEDEPIDYVVGLLKAEDPDDDFLQFDIVGEIANSILQLVYVGPKSSNITLKSELDRETIDRYSIVFQVADGSNNVIQQYASLYVEDVNDNAPTFVGLPYRAEIPEDADQGALVFKVSATDPDSGIWGLVTYSITTPQDLFSINPANGEVRLEGELDYETEKFYQLEIMGADGGTPPLNSTTDLIILVQDVQDTPPFFLNLPYIASVYENASVGTQVLKVSALDGDRGVPNEVNYTFYSEDNRGYFAISADEGWITVARPMNREERWVLDRFGVLDMVILAEEDTPTPQGPTTATAPATIRILDINDQIPTFNLSEYTATVLENTQIRIPVTFLPENTEMMVKDLDEGDNGRFELYLEDLNGQPFGVFDASPGYVLNEASVLIRVKNSSALDYEEVTSYTFNVIAREYLTDEKHQGSTQVTVELEDVNDNWPEFDKEEYTAEIEENSPKGTIVDTITATDRDSGLWGELTYYLRGASANLFQVDNKTGVVSVAVDADQDHTLLDRETQATHYVAFEAVDGGGLRTSVQLLVTLSDVNDNAPVMGRTQYEGFIKENEADMEREIVIEATDIDLPPNSDIRYSIIGGDPLGNFTLDDVTGVLSVVAPLDYEAMEPAVAGRFTLNVMAQDMGVPPLNDTVNVIVDVQDMNDNVPYFESDLYTESIAENSAPGFSVLTVVAHDDDGTAPNNEIIYRIEDGARNKFRIDAESGTVTVENGANLDWNLFGKTYNLTVMATDRGTPSLSNSTRVRIDITDVNNKDPVFDPDRRYTSILENTTVGTQFFTYTAYDLDEDALLRYRLLHDQVIGEDEMKRPVQDTQYLMNLFEIEADTGDIYVNSSLDRETVEEITITVFVEDLNAQFPPQQNTTALLFITLLDVNDNAPEFQPSDVYYARISEASKPGIEVKQVFAIDRDKNEGPIVYSMEYDPDNAWTQAFEITDANKHAGVITLKSEVDHEETEWINITVKATDSGNPPLSSTAQVLVDIEDVNDNSPVWEKFEEEVWVWENATLEEFVTEVYATDRDSGEFGRVMYYITTGHDDKFYIHNNSGVIQTSGLLDRETVPDYRVIVEARDNNLAPPSEQRRTPGNMHVRLRDVNDNHPIFEKPLYSAEIRENEKVDSVIAIVRATDADEGVNAQIVYSIDPAGGNATDMFGVEAVTGRVFVARSLSGMAGEYFTEIIATDKGTPPLANKTILYVEIEDVNDHPPVIVHPLGNETVEIWENVPTGTYVTYVSATDLDDGPNGIVEYEFIENPGGSHDYRKFVIDRKTGNITTANYIDREEQETYFLEVRAYDLGNPSYDDRALITVVALDENDNLPEFDRDKHPPPHHVSVLEEHSNIYVANVSLAEDPDIGNNSIICYYLVGGDRPYMEQFYVNKSTGELWLGPSIDREEVGSVKLMLKADEDCWSGFWDLDENRYQQWNYSDLSMLWIDVTIIDINDNPPRFTKSWFTAGVTKDTQFGEEVIDFGDYSYDLDIGNNSIMFYYLQEPFNYSEPLGSQLKQRGEKEPFTLGQRDGILRTNIYFQQNMQGYIEFKVFVNDSAPEHFDVADVSIYLLNEDQRVKIVLRGEPDEVGEFKDLFADFLSNITGVIINVDKIQTHMDFAGKPDLLKTDMFIHGIYPDNGEVLDAEVLIDFKCFMLGDGRGRVYSYLAASTSTIPHTEPCLIDKNYLYLVDLFKQYNVIEVKAAVEDPSPGLSGDVTLALILLACILGCILIIVCATFFTCRKKYKRKLKAATAMAFGNNHNPTMPNGRDLVKDDSMLGGSRDAGMNRLEMPGTNMHSYEGKLSSIESSNPIWLEQYNNQPTWPQDSSDTESGKNSLDENSVTPPSAAAPPRTSGYDEQEMSVDMLNDEFDHFNKAVSGKHLASSDIFLKTAIGNGNGNGNGKAPMRNGKANHAPAPPTQNGLPLTTTTGNGLRRNHSNGPEGSKNGNGKVNHLYDNHGFEMQATEI